MEAVTGYGNMKFTWSDILTEVAFNYSHGVNRVILHGSPYSKSVNGFTAQWPGWLAFGNNFTESFTYRQPYWDDAATIGDYMARNQAVLQSGTAKLDFAVFRVKSRSFSLGNGNGFQTMLNNGYSYSILNGAVLGSPNANVTHGMLHENGSAYKALVLDLNTAGTTTATEIKTIYELADAGLPVIIYGANIPTAIYGTDMGESSQENMLSALSSLRAHQNVFEIASGTTAEMQQRLLELFRNLGITPRASYNIERLETTTLADKTNGTYFYYLFHSVTPSASGMVQANIGNNTYKAAAPIEGTVTLTGEGVPYYLNAWTGEITPFAAYTNNGNGTVSVDISLSGGESALIAILPVGAGTHIIHTTGGTPLFTDDGELALRVTEAGNYQVEVSDGEKFSLNVKEVHAGIPLNDGWDLRLESFGPDRSEANKQPGNRIHPSIAPIAGLITGDSQLYKDPSNTIKTNVYFADISLGQWQNLNPAQASATEGGAAFTGLSALLAHLSMNTTYYTGNNGVINTNPTATTMQNMSGIGYYANIFNLPDT
jgi:hypothetical protein